MTRVLVVDDCPLTREVLADLLNADPEISVVGTACNGSGAVRQAHRGGIDVITMDVHMPGMGGVEATRRIMAECPCPVIAVHGDWTVPDARDAERALEAGAVSAVEKSIGRGRAELDMLGARLRDEVKKADRGRRQPERVT